MNEQEALAIMVAPGSRKPHKWLQGVIQIWVTRACDKSCFCCTQGSNFGGNPGMISMESFEQACLSLREYHGVVGVFGGNPAMHPKFEQLCEILSRHIPWNRRGLWCNNPLGKASVMRQTFNPRYSNLNVHLDQSAYDEFKRDWPECSPCGLTTDSSHSPVYNALQDMEDLTDDQRWQLISRCDIGREWSGMFGEFRGQLRWWWCEVAGAQAMLHQREVDYPDTGLAVDTLYGGKQCWDLTMQEYASQVRFHCMACGVPLRGRGELAQSTTGTEQVTATHAKVCKPKQPDRLIQLVTRSQDVQPQSVRTVVDYIGNGKGR